MQYSVVMTSKKDEKNLGGMMDADIVDRFVIQADQRGFKKKRALAAAAKIWLQLPEDIQSRIINENTSEEIFTVLVQQIVQYQLDAFRAVLTPAQRKVVDDNLKATKEKIAQKK